MFGYIIINKAELKFREFDVYQSFYCGLCRRLKEKYGIRGQLSLSYDMTFLIMLLTGLYEPKTRVQQYRCLAHPLEKHKARINLFTEYAADMNVLFSYYKCMDDWADEKKYTRLAYGRLLKGFSKELRGTYGQKGKQVDRLLRELSKKEASQGQSMDEMAGYFGRIMEELFAWRQDEWEESLRRMGFYLGKFIYLMDAYEDLEEDRKTGSYNPFASLQEGEKLDQMVREVLTMMMTECSREFERLPILKNAEILRNILYSGVWRRFEVVHGRRQEKRTGNHE